MDETQTCSACHGVGCGWIDICSNKLIICKLKKRKECLSYPNGDMCMCSNCKGTGRVSWIDSLFNHHTSNRRKRNKEYYKIIRNFLDKYNITINDDDEKVIDILNLRKHVIIKSDNFIEFLCEDRVNPPYQYELPEI